MLDYLQTVISPSFGQIGGGNPFRNFTVTCNSSGEVLLTPTKIYSRLLLPILCSGAVKAYAHITGGGLLENIPRVLPKELAVDLGGRKAQGILHF